MIFGVDEAGRGAIIGNMYIAIVGVEKTVDISNLRDSKTYTIDKIHRLAERYLKDPRVHYLVAEIPPSTIDYHIQTKFSNLNRLEDVVISDLVNVVSKYLPVGTVYVDNYKYHRKAEYEIGIYKYVTKGDEKIKIISLASIIAKHFRERHMESLRARFPDIGSGYPSDENTMKFVRRTEFAQLKEILRYSWKPVSIMRYSITNDWRVFGRLLGREYGGSSRL